MRAILGFVAVAGFLLVSSMPGQAATFTVNSTADEPDLLVGDGLCASASGACTLRAAIQEANALPGADAIDVPAGVYRLTVGPGFAVDEDAAANGDLDITDDLVITGAGPTKTIVSAKKLDRVFQVLSPATVEIDGITIRDGLSLAGGGIWNLGTLTLQDVVVTNNRAADPSQAGSICQGEGAGIENQGTLAVLGSSIEHNRGCSASGYTHGGGIENSGDLTLTNTTVSYNRATTGGGILNSGTVMLTNVTLMYNAAVSVYINSTAGMGGGLMNAGTAHLVNATVAYNHANNHPYNGGGGVDNRGASTALVTFTNSIVRLNSRYDCSGNPSFTATQTPGFMVSLGHNLRGSGCPILFPSGGDRDVPDPMLLNMTHGFPRTLPLAPASPAIDAGDDSVCPPTDERGLPRPQDGDGDSIATCDIGAYERQP